MTDRVLLRPSEAMRAMGIGRSLMYSLLRRGAIRSVRLNSGHYRIPVDALREAIDATTVQPSATNKRSDEVQGAAQQNTGIY